jgi:cobalamin biosynthesis Mg chelatase CobN
LKQVTGAVFVNVSHWWKHLCSKLCENTVSGSSLTRELLTRDTCVQELKKKIVALQKDSKAAKSTATSKSSQVAKATPPAQPVMQPQKKPSVQTQQQRVAVATATAVTGDAAGQQTVAQPEQQNVYCSR